VSDGANSVDSEQSSNEELLARRVTLLQQALARESTRLQAAEQRLDELGLAPVDSGPAVSDSDPDAPAMTSETRATTPPPPKRPTNAPPAPQDEAPRAKPRAPRRRPATFAGEAAPARQAPLPAGFIGSIVAMGLIYFGFKFIRYALDSWSTLILVEQFRMSTTIAAYLSTAFDWIGFLGVIVGGFWSDRMPGARRTPVIFWMTAGCFVFTTLMWLVGLSSPLLFVIMLGLIGFTAMGPDSLLSGACAMDIGSRRQAALAAGVINGLGSIGPIVQEPLIGWLKETHGSQAVLLLLVGVVFVTAVATGLLARFEHGRV